MANTKKGLRLLLRREFPKRGKGETEHQGFTLFSHKKVGVPKGGGKSRGNYAHGHHAFKVTHDLRRANLVNWAILATNLVTVNVKDTTIGM